MEVRLNSLLLFLKAPPEWGKQRVHYICSIPSSKSIQKSSVREKKTEISSGIVISHQEAS
ncbi:Uncharacterised protein [Enterobacter hormaechei]|nr:Uncharacterised protein [Enterobacter hormaechei]